MIYCHKTSFKQNQFFFQCSCIFRPYSTRPGVQPTLLIYSFISHPSSHPIELIPTLLTLHSTSFRGRWDSRIYSGASEGFWAPGGVWGIESCQRKFKWFSYCQYSILQWFSRYSGLQNNQESHNEHFMEYMSSLKEYTHKVFYFIFCFGEKEK